MTKTKEVGPTKAMVTTLLEALEKEAGMTVKDHELATRILGAAMAMSEVSARVDEAENQTHVIVNGDVVNGYKFYGPFESEDEAFTFAQNQFHLTKRWSVVELQKPIDR